MLLKKDESLPNESLFDVILGTPLLKNFSKQRHRLLPFRKLLAAEACWR